MTYTVFPIEPPLSPSDLAAYKTLRLTSLQADPQAFLSTYAREAAFSEDTWRERLDSPFKQTFVASVLDDAYDASDERGDVNSDPGKRGEWIGTASIMGPSGMTPYLDPFKAAGVSTNWEMYGLVAMWVHPAHRSKGVGARLVNGCLEWARTNVDVNFSSGNRGEFEKVVVLLVYDDNIAGRALYSRIGFTDLEGVAAREGERWMSIKV